MFPDDKQSRLRLKCDGTLVTHGRGSEGKTGEWSG